MIEALRPNKVDLAIGVATGIIYSFIAPSNEAAIVLAPIVVVVTPYIGKVAYRLYGVIKELDFEKIDRADGYYGLKSDHAKSGIAQINILEEEGLQSPREAERGRQLYAKRHRGQ